MVVKFKCEYNGEKFFGFQRQGEKRTVQMALEEAIGKYLNSEIKLAASGRTDSGVHARMQVCSFQCPVDIDLFKLNAAVNAFLPADVSASDFEAADDSFHAQFSAKAKTYLYRVYINRHRSPLRDNFYHQIYKMPAVELMKDCANELVGRHCFKSFTAEQTDSHDFVREILSFCIEQHGDELWFWVRGSGFMRNMVRIMTGTILDIGLGKKEPDLIRKILNEPDRTAAGQTAPAKALVLYDVEY